MEPLSRPFNVIVNAIAAKLYPTGFDVSANAPGNWFDLFDRVYNTGRMTVSNVNSEKTIFADAETNYAFRAWHDHCHLRNRDSIFLGSGHTRPLSNGAYPGTFDWAGEVWVYQQMVQDVVKVYGECSPDISKLLEAEVIGQFLHKEVWGDFPNDQMAFTRDYLVAPWSALLTRAY